MSSIKALLDDYEVCLARIRACRVPVTKMQRVKDIERVLYSQGQEDEYDVDDENAASDHRKLFRESDTPKFATMMEAHTQHPFARNYRETVAEKCRELLDGIVKPKFAVLYIVALGKRKLLWELLPDQIERYVVRVRHDQRMG